LQWHNLKRLALEGLASENTRLLREHAAQRFGTLLEQSGGSSGSGGGSGSSNDGQ